MEKASPLIVLFIFFIILAYGANEVMANICQESLGGCDQCNERCKAKRGPKSEGDCQSRIYNLCMCNYQCGPPPPPPEPKVCYGGAGLCSQKCSNNCCNQICANKYSRGNGFCEKIGSINLCKCQYPC
ncbi:hypothetical protein ARALYDRAFT_913481 [Arabidopsis lyrata subsp. lyrata]|uniref:Defensin-like protein n=1 Tax=Arabidopsis lyrata subsp. lyrata TaxID=81972 RepID=D7MC94_ARALL|nr:hypothetical protein ARALYDRAFT_913481 [Arabidopsis lyrata subsp. lyrata]